jgi:hypothetical protein
VSLAVVACGRWQIVAAADSRSTSDGIEAGSDSEIKLIECGSRTLCGLVGFTTLIDPVANWREKVSDRVRKMCDRDGLQDSPALLLEAIRADTTPMLARRFALSPWPPGVVPFGAFAIKRDVSGLIEFLDLQYADETTGAGGRRMSDPVLKIHLDGQQSGVYLYATGRGDCLSPSLVRKMNPDLPDEGVLAQIEGLFADAAANGRAEGSIGGPIDVAVIDASGVRWLRRKPLPVARLGRGSGSSVAEFLRWLGIVKPALIGAAAAGGHPSS